MVVIDTSPSVLAASLNRCPNCSFHHVIANPEAF